MKQRVLTVGAILVNPAGKILIQQRDEKPGLKYPGYWTTFGGKVEDGEHPDEAMRRELLEEIELEPEVHLWKVREFTEEFEGEPVLVEQWLYTGHIDRDAAHIMLNEGQALGFFGADDLDELPIAFGLKSVFREFFSPNGVHS
ncbi:MAG: NUDIX domain-containing protein [Anaerolineae bacterium]|nr:NUDIX domain-containing protein [Anaerolineae bacterium]